MPLFLYHKIKPQKDLLRLEVGSEHKILVRPKRRFGLTNIVCRLIHSFICFFNNATDNTQWTYNK